MGALAELNELEAAKKDMTAAKFTPAQKAAFKKWSKVGWKNLCYMIVYDASPADLKEGRRQKPGKE